MGSTNHSRQGWSHSREIDRQPQGVGPGLTVRA